MKEDAFGTNPRGHSSADFTGTEHSPNRYAELRVISAST